MRTVWQQRLIRYSFYLLCLLGIPVLVFVGWRTLVVEQSVLDPVWYIFGSQVLVVIFFIYLLSSRVANRLPSEREVAYVKSLRAQVKFVTLYERSPVPYMVLDKKTGAIRMYNLAAVRMFQTTTEDLLGTNFVELLTYENAEYLKDLRRTIKRGNVVADQEVQIRTVTGQIRWVRLSVFVQEIEKEQLVSLVDITRLKEMDAVKSEFVALATHQLRTPIAAIRWNAELLQKKLSLAEDHPAITYLEKISRNVKRMNTLINDFLNVSKLEMGTFATKPVALELASYFDNIVDEFASDIAAKEIDVVRHYEPQKLTTTVDERLLHIVVSNIFSNAVKYVSPKDQIQLSYELVQHSIRIEVRDTGIGIPSEDQAQLFTKFFRASNAQQHRAEGTGLGLYVVQQSIQQMGGTITMDSVEGVGTLFTVTIPHHTS